MRARAPLAVVLGGGVVLAAAAALRPVPVLVLENPERGRALVVRVAPGEAFAVTSQHSMYDAPVTEEFVAGAGGTLSLRSVWSPSAAVREYFGLTGPGERQVVRRTLPEIVFRVAMGAAQRLRAGGVERSFLEVGDHGDRLVLRLARRPAIAARVGRAGALP